MTDADGTSERADGSVEAASEQRHVATIVTGKTPSIGPPLQLTDQAN